MMMIAAAAISAHTMIWFLLVPFVAFFAAKEFLFDSPFAEGVFDKIMGCLMVIVVSLMAAAVSTGIAFVCGLPFQSHPIKLRTDTLVAIRTKDGVQGQFFLGTGTVEGNQYYFYYRQTADGGFTPGKIYAGTGTTVYEEDRKDAQLVTYQWVLNQEWAWMVGFPTSAGGHAYDFHVPTGTILRGFSM